MGLRGPKPQPSAILAARGSWRANANPNEAIPEAGMPSCPAEVKADADALRNWRRIVPKLVAAGLATKLDGEVLGHYCVMRGLRDQAVKAARTTRNAETRIGLVKHVLELTRACSRVEDQYGMTPATRARIVVPSNRSKADGSEEPKADDASNFVRFPLQQA